LSTITGKPVRSEAAAAVDAGDAALARYLPLLLAAQQMFEPAELARLAPRTRAAIGEIVKERGDSNETLPSPLSSLPSCTTLDPIAGTEEIAYGFIAKGGKYWRPFMALAVYDALTGGRGARSGGQRHLAELPVAVKRAAMSIEIFHKASLVHDDIEDDDPFRYGEPTLHRSYGTPVAINVGDYLIGLGYRLVSRESATLGPETVSDILDRLADAHMKLSEGQGAELLWRDSSDKKLTPADALHIYALKTSPAFEAALLTGLRLAGPTDCYIEPIMAYSRALGVAFQILNDLGDWRPDRHNKLVAAGDVVGGRPTVLWALALEGLSAQGRAELQRLAGEIPATDATIRHIRRLYREANVFDKAEQLIGEYEEAARQVAAALEPRELRRLLLNMIEIVLARPVVPIDQS
jgi:geranylgeranyl pyrophosphate synthase